MEDNGRDRVGAVRTIVDIGRTKMTRVRTERDADGVMEQPWLKNSQSELK